MSRINGTNVPDDILDFNSQYRPVSWLGFGSFGSVLKAEDRKAKSNSRRFVAIKMLPRGHRIDVNVRREIINHRNLSHPHIIQFRKAFLTRHYLCIVLEYAPGGSMYEYVTTRQYMDGEFERGRLREDEARWYFQQLIIAVQYLHQAGVACRDIKLENALLMDNAVAPNRLPMKLCDFGYSKSVLDSVANSRVGTICYMSPETLTCKPTESYDPYVADLWSCGCFLYVIVTGTYPFARQTDYELQTPKQQMLLMERTTAGDYTRTAALRAASPELQSLISRLLVVDPRQRATLAEVIEHPWFKQGLPEGALAINVGCATDISAQSVAEVDAIIKQARTRSDDIDLLYG